MSEQAPGLEYSQLAAGAPAEGVPMRGMTAVQAVGVPVGAGATTVPRVEARPLPTPYCHYDVALPDSVDEERPPIFLGATNGHWPLSFNCPACHYSGQTTTRYGSGHATKTRSPHLTIFIPGGGQRPLVSTDLHVSWSTTWGTHTQPHTKSRPGGFGRVLTLGFLLTGAPGTAHTAGRRRAGRGGWAR